MCARSEGNSSCDCGYTITPNPIESDEYRDVWSEENWEKISDGEYRCRRLAEDSGRCIWHSDQGNKSVGEMYDKRTEGPERLDGLIIRDIDLSGEDIFSECSLQNATFEDVDLEATDFKRASLIGSEFKGEIEATRVNFQGADLRDIDADNIEYIDFSEGNFSHSNMTGFFSSTSLEEFGCNIRFSGANFENTSMPLARFSYCNLKRTNMDRIDADGAVFRNSNLGGSDIFQSDLRNADFLDAYLYQSYISDVRINEETEFGDKCIYEKNPCGSTSDEDDVNGYEAAAWVYRRLQTIFNENAISYQAREYHVRKREAKRKLAKEEGNRTEWILSAGDRWFTRHGERPRRVLGWWIVIIGVSTVVYSLGGVQEGATLYKLTPGGRWDLISGVSVVLRSLVVSIASFSTLGSGNLQPSNEWIRGLVSIESLLGTIFIALYVFTLGRRVDW